MEKYYSPNMVAEAMGVDVLHIYKWIKEGKLKAEKQGGRFIILFNDFANFKKPNTNTNTNKTTAATFTIKIDQKIKLKEEAEKQNVTVSFILREAIDLYLDIRRPHHENIHRR